MFKKILEAVAVLIIAALVAAVVATRCVAQQMVPPPPVMSFSQVDITRLEQKIDDLRRDQQSTRTMVKQIWVLMNPRKLEQQILDLNEISR